MLRTPVLFLVFNRPDTTKRVFEQIRAARPSRLFIGADGPRADKQGESEKCEEVRRIATNVDWDCEVRTLFRDKNLGCGIAVSEAITWFFENVEEGIILEDDCLPDLTFFTFCERQLDIYRDVEQIGIISGNNFVNSVWPILSLRNYLFSAYPFTWGWATTAKNWQNVDYSLSEINVVILSKQLRKFFFTDEVIVFWLRMFRIYSENQYNNWDYRFALNQFSSGKLHIVPQVNLVSNIGFDSAATHTRTGSNLFVNLKANRISCNFAPKRSIKQNIMHDAIISEYVYGVFIVRPFMLRLIRKILRDSARIIFSLRSLRFRIKREKWV